jgi:transposase
MAEKARLVAAMDEPDAVVTEIARAAGVDISLLYRRRRQLAATREAPAFVPLMVAFDASEAAQIPRGALAMFDSRFVNPTAPKIG